MRRLSYFCGGFALATALAVALPSVYWYGASLLCAVAVVIALWKHISNRVLQRIFIVLAGLAMGLCYTNLAMLYRDIPVAKLAGDTHRITGTVTQWPVPLDNDRYSVEVKLQLENGGTLGALLYMDEVGEKIAVGDDISTIARLYDARVTDEGEVHTRNSAQGIFITGLCYGKVEITRPSTVPLWLQPIHFSRTLQEGIQTAFSEDSVPLITTLVTGDKALLEPEMVTALQRTGMSHTVAVSGMHLGFLAGMLTLLLGVNRRRTAVIVIFISVLFAIMVGASPSILRATIMITMVLLAPLFHRQTDGITSLSFALVLILLPNPYVIAHVGLQLSFGSLLGLFCCGDPLFNMMMGKIQEKFGRKRNILCRMIRKLMGVVIAILSATLGVMAITTPIIVYYFTTVSLVAPLTNLVALWTVVWCFGSGLIASGVAVIAPQLGQLLALPVEPLVDYFYWVNETLGNIPFGALPTTSEFGVGFLIFVYAVVLFWLWRRRELHPAVPLAAIALGLALTISSTIYESKLGAVSVTALDVGQGQSIFLRMGETTALVDCGGSYGAGVGEYAADFIVQSGTLTLDYLILTHCHADHCNGVMELMERLHVGELILPATEGEDEGLRGEILALAEKKMIPVTLVSRDDSIPVETGTIDLIPPLGDMDENERGLTILARYEEFDTLITGDMDEDTEKRLVYRYDLPEVDLYIVGHHGSKYASSQVLLDEIQPDKAIISAGYNYFGHPTPETLERLDKMNTAVYRTDEQGNITVRVGE